MALNFPTPQNIGETHTDPTSGFTYEWDGTVWKGATPPVSTFTNITVTGIITATDFNSSGS